MKNLVIILLLAALSSPTWGQDSTKSRRERKQEQKDNKREKIKVLMRQAEEGVLIYTKQSIFGVQFRSNGYGVFYELGRMKTTRKTMIYRVDLTEIKHAKEEKLPSGNGVLGNPFVYGKINNFYQLTLAIGQQYMLGQKGNKNGVAVSAIYNGGFSLGLVRPYYLEIGLQGGDSHIIKYSVPDSMEFVGPNIRGAGGLGKGWNEIKIQPGAFVKAALRFDYGRFNEVVSGLEAGVSIEAYGSKIPIMLRQKDKQLFFQGYLSLLFGRRK